MDKDPNMVQKEPHWQADYFSKACFPHSQLFTGHP